MIGVVGVMDKEFKRINKKSIKRLIEYVERCYNKRDTELSPQDSNGDLNFCFEDGFSCGYSWAIYEICDILGIEIEEPGEGFATEVLGL